ncbi:MAG: hypothetical protein QOI17_178, partial [Gaiellales bacterium]|nr:hypothetical protein [Gaiellales bacterium]
MEELSPNGAAPERGVIMLTLPQGGDSAP